MSNQPVTDFSEFNRFVAERLSVHDNCSLENALAEFREYQRQLARLKAKLAEAEVSAARGDVARFEADELIAELDRELADEGIPD